MIVICDKKYYVLGNAHTIQTQKYKQKYYKKKCNIFIPSTHSVELVAVYPSIQVHIPSRHVAYRDPMHCSFKSQD